VADAHAVYNHLYESGDVVECGCWAHARRYFFNAIETDKVRAEFALNTIQTFFNFEKQWAAASPAMRLEARQRELKPALSAFFDWCDTESDTVLDGTPISKAIQYARNQREALQTFLTDGRVPIHNNVSERNLRRQAVGRKNWLFVGSDEGGKTNATLVSLLASCEMHKIEPFSYLRDLLCLLPGWNSTKVIELAPANWRATSARTEVVAALISNPFRMISASER
jgi:transposase